MGSLFDPDRSAERLPVSLITGFLGSGKTKTTLLNRLVQRPELADSAVIINEFGEIALDHLLVAPVDGETVVLASGCLCCAVRGDLQDTLLRLLIERDLPPLAGYDTSQPADASPDPTQSPDPYAPGTVAAQPAVPPGDRLAVEIGAGFRPGKMRIFVDPWADQRFRRVAETFDGH